MTIRMSGSSEAFSRRPAGLKAPRQVSRVPAGWIRPNVTVELLRKAAVQRGIYAPRSGSA